MTFYSHKHEMYFTSVGAYEDYLDRLVHEEADVLNYEAMSLIEEREEYEEDKAFYVEAITSLLRKADDNRYFDDEYYSQLEQILLEVENA